MTPARILVVEDEAIVAEDIREMLSAGGYSPVGPCASGEAAVRKAAQEKPDLTLMDIHLKGAMDGVEAARTIADQGVGVIFLTAFADEATIARAKLASPYGYIVKPFDRRDLESAIEVALYKRETEAALEKHRQLLASVLTGIADSVIAVDAQGRVTLLNGAAEALLGTSYGEAVGLPLGEVAQLTTENGTSLADALLTAIEQSEQYRLPRRARLILPEGRVNRIEGVFTSTHDAGRRPTGGVLVLQDAERREALTTIIPSDAAERAQMLQRVRELV